MQLVQTSGKKFTPAEDDAIRMAVEEAKAKGKPRTWLVIAQDLLPNRSKSALSVRKCKIDASASVQPEPLLVNYRIELDDDRRVVMAAVNIPQALAVLHPGLAAHIVNVVKLASKERDV